MNPNASPSVSVIFANWQKEDRGLESCVDQVRDWMREVAQLGIPHFGETATRLRPLRHRLVQHFAREDEMIEQLAQLYSSSSPEIEAVRRQSVHDHDQLLARLDNLINRLNELVPPFDSWQTAIDDVEMFVDLLEQHEEQESESVQMLMPSRQTKNSCGEPGES